MEQKSGGQGACKGSSRWVCLGPESGRESKGVAYPPPLKTDRFLLALLTLLWATPALFMYYLLRYYDPFTQNFYRYAIGFLTVLPWACGNAQKATLTKRSVLLACLAAVPNAIHQLAQTEALEKIPPGTLTVLLRLSAPLTALFVLWHLPEERRVVLSGRYWVGLAVALLGTFGITGRLRLGSGGWGALAWGLLAALGWALYTTLAKRPSEQLGATVSFAWISGFTSFFLLVATLAKGRLSLLLEAPAGATILLAISAILCIGLAHVVYYRCIQHLGASVAQTVQFLCPVGTVVLSNFFFGERWTVSQGLSAALLLLGSWIASQSARRTPAQPAQGEGSARKDPSLKAW
jgi:drug/metabolite transporter (DMT)-like permease